jgi:hypothetical protein
MEMPANHPPFTEPDVERAARAVAQALGFNFAGPSIVQSARLNPRAHQFVSIARAVLETVQPNHTEERDGNEGSRS